MISSIPNRLVALCCWNLRRAAAVRVRAGGVCHGLAVRQWDRAIGVCTRRVRRVLHLVHLRCLLRVERGPLLVHGLLLLHLPSLRRDLSTERRLTRWLRSSICWAHRWLLLTRRMHRRIGSNGLVLSALLRLLRRMAGLAAHLHGLLRLGGRWGRYGSFGFDLLSIWLLRSLLRLLRGLLDRSLRLLLLNWWLRLLLLLGRLLSVLLLRRLLRRLTLLILLILHCILLELLLILSKLGNRSLDLVILRLHLWFLVEPVRGDLLPILLAFLHHSRHLL